MSFLFVRLMVVMKIPHENMSSPVLVIRLQAIAGYLTGCTAIS